MRVALSVPRESLAVIGFDSEIHAIKNFNEHASAEVKDWVSRLLSIPPGGFTHIELGLRTAREWIEKSAYPQARVILVSDGRYTEGRDPVDVVKGQSFVHTIKVGKDPNGRKIMREIADHANGNFHEVREMSELPRVLLSAVRSWVR